MRAAKIKKSNLKITAKLCFAVIFLHIRQQNKIYLYCETVCNRMSRRQGYAKGADSAAVRYMLTAGFFAANFCGKTPGKRAEGCATRKEKDCASFLAAQPESKRRSVGEGLFAAN